MTTTPIGQYYCPICRCQFSGGKTRLRPFVSPGSANIQRNTDGEPRAMGIARLSSSFRTAEKAFIAGRGHPQSRLTSLLYCDLIPIPDPLRAPSRGVLMVGSGAVPAGRLSQSLNSGGAEPRPPGIKTWARGARSRLAQMLPASAGRTPKSTAVERRRARASFKRRGAPWLRGRGLRSLKRLLGAPLPLVWGARKKNYGVARAANSRASGALACSALILRRAR